MIRLFLILLFTASAFSASAEWLGEWLEKNEPLVIEYVLSLKPSEIPIEGVMLTDGNAYLKNFRYKSQLEKDRPGTNVHLFEKDGKYIAIIWLDSEATPLPLPECEPGSEGSKFPWYRGSVISGDVYTYRDVQPGHGIVINYCPSASWLGVNDA